MKKVLVLAILCMVLVLSACGSAKTTGEKGESGQAAFKEIENARGDKIKLPLHPKRIADLSGSTEELLLLGIKPIASANADFGVRDVFTPTIKDKLDPDTINLGWYAEPIGIELVADAEPDLIILGTLFNEDLYEQLSQIAPTVVVPHPYYAWRERFAFLAELFDKKDVMDKWLVEYEQKVVDWKDKLTPIIQDQSFAMIETYPNNLVAYSSTGSAELIYKDFGFKRTEGIPEPDHWGGREMSLEGLSTINPDHLLIMENSENKMSDSKVWGNLKAVQQDNVYRITNIDNYNYSYTAMGRMHLLDEIGTLILEKNKK
ncbi:ABC transporter substrate-binding protein [Paenibacillaceae bacterium]|nr:ABC transporter substrate-binding protein [Paenibacillaceae bacterium]